MTQQRDSIPERLASNPGTPVAAAALLLASLNPLSPIKHAVDGAKKLWAKVPGIPGHTPPELPGGTVGDAPAAPTPPADAEPPVASPTPAPAENPAVIEYLRTAWPPGASEAALATIISGIPWSGNPSQVHPQPFYDAAEQASRLLNTLRLRGADAAVSLYREQLAGPAIHAAPVPGALNAPVPTFVPVNAPPTPEPPGPGLLPSPPTSGNDGDRWADAIDQVKDGLKKAKVRLIPGTSIPIPTDTDVAGYIGDRAVPVVTNTAEFLVRQPYEMAGAGFSAVTNAVNRALGPLFGRKRVVPRDELQADINRAVQRRK